MFPRLSSNEFDFQVASLSWTALRERSQKVVTSLLSQRKMILIIDLDRCFMALKSPDTLTVSESKEYFELTESNMFMKIRPGFDDFLRCVQSDFLVYILSQNENLMEVIDKGNEVGWKVCQSPTNAYYFLFNESLIMFRITLDPKRAFSSNGTQSLKDLKDVFLAAHFDPYRWLCLILDTDTSLWNSLYRSQILKISSFDPKQHPDFSEFRRLLTSVQQLNQDFFRTLQKNSIAGLDMCSCIEDAGAAVAQSLALINSGCK